MPGAAMCLRQQTCMLVPMSVIGGNSKGIQTELLQYAVEDLPQSACDPRARESAMLKLDMRWAFS